MSKRFHISCRARFLWRRRASSWDCGCAPLCVRVFLSAISHPPLHKTPVPNYQETVFEDVKNTFKKILKDKIFDFINLEIGPEWLHDQQ